MTLEASFVLHLDRHWRILTKGDQPADAFAAACGDVIAARSVTVFAGLLLSLVPRIKQENFTHHCLGKFFKLRGVTCLADFVADISGWLLLGWFGFRRPDHLRVTQQETAEQTQDRKSLHGFSGLLCEELVNSTGVFFVVNSTAGRNRLWVKWPILLRHGFAPYATTPEGKRSLVHWDSH